jgi:glycosyltransferase involved in cell wall biosynthesis
VSSPPVSVVLPLHRTATSLDELLDRLVAACPDATEYVLVDDRCPDRSGDLVLARWRHLPGRLVRIGDNVGQHAAVQAGLRHTRGERVVVMDADLQDLPEDAPRLLAALTSSGADVVCAGRRGEYADPGRQRSARAYRWAARLLSGGRIPVDAGMFSAWTRSSVDRVVALDDHAAPLIPAAALAGLRITTVPVVRRARPRGRSATSSLRRVRIALRGLVTLTPLHPVARRLRTVRRRAPAAEVVELGFVPSVPEEA